MSIVENLIQKMTLKEKIGQLNQPILGWEVYEKCGDEFELTEKFKDFVKKFGGVGAVYGLLRADPWSGKNFSNGVPPEASARLTNKLQKYILENTSLKIPAFISEEIPHGHQSLNGTVFPVNLGVASTFNNSLHCEAYRLLAREVRSRGGNLGLSSGLDMLRDPRWGRSEETFGEDPFLASQFSKSLVGGIQCENQLGAVIKHFAAQGENMGGHNIFPASIGPRELREIHIPAMKGAISSDVMACMAAYVEIDGIPCHSNYNLLTEILRNELGFNGFVMSDLGAIDRNIIQTGNDEQAAALAINAGVDLSLCDAVYTKLENAVEAGLVSVDTINKAVERILTAKEKLGLFENPYTDENNYKIYCNCKEIKDINLKLATESIVLLKNNNILPLKSAKTLAVIGPHIYQPYYQLGDYVATQSKSDCITILDGIKQVYNNTLILDSQGCTVRGNQTDGFKDAIQKANKSDAVILTLGGSSAREFAGEFEATGSVKSGSASEMDCGEGVDVANLSLGGVQEDLFLELKKTGKPIIVVLIQGRPYAIDLISKYADAIICAWYPGQMGGLAIANILSGKSIPSGKLPVSVPRESGQLPVYYNYKDIGREPKYSDLESSPLYPFGFGLSYSEFKVIDISCQPEIKLDSLLNGEQIDVNITIKNIGSTDAYETIQLYVRDIQSSVSHRIKELKGYKKVFVKAGEAITAVIPLSSDELSLYNTEMKFTVEKGDFLIMAGFSSVTEVSTVIKVK